MGVTTAMGVVWAERLASTGDLIGILPCPLLLALLLGCSSLSLEELPVLTSSINFFNGLLELLASMVGGCGGREGVGRGGGAWVLPFDTETGKGELPLELLLTDLVGDLETEPDLDRAGELEGDLLPDTDLERDLDLDRDLERERDLECEGDLERDPDFDLDMDGDRETLLRDPELDLECDLDLE